jgi:hypothetical protein
MWKRGIKTFVMVVGVKQTPGGHGGQLRLRKALYCSQRAGFAFDKKLTISYMNISRSRIGPLGESWNGLLLRLKKFA